MLGNCVKRGKFVGDRLAMEGGAIVCLYPAEGNENENSEEGGCPKE
jgi:hypothetical protein